MLEYTSKNMADGLRTEDVSRIAYQLLSAVDHCDKHNILHRDIKVRGRGNAIHNLLFAYHHILK